MKFSGNVGNEPKNSWLNFGDDPDQGSGSGYVFGSGSGYAKTFLGGGMH